MMTNPDNVGGLPMVAGGGNVTAREVIRTAMQEAGKS